MTQWLIGVDIGGTTVRVTIAPVENLSIKTMKTVKQDTAKDNPLSISGQVIEMIKSLLEQEELSPSQVVSIGIATAGPIDMAKGEIFNNANLGFKTIPLRSPVSQAFPGLPISIVNDCNGAVLGVRYFEAEPSEKNNMAYVTISTGIGGGVIANGHLVLGKEGNAAEVGHGVIAPRSGIMCNCGAEGCWEAFSSGTAVAKQARESMKIDRADSSILLDIVQNDVSKISAKDVYKAARNGDAFSKEIVDEANFFNAIGIGMINNFYDIIVVYLGGSMLKDEDQILGPLRDMFKEKPLAFTINKPPILKKSKLGDDVGLLGALALGKYKLENDQVLH